MRRNLARATAGVMAFTRKRRKALKVNRNVQKRTVLSENERQKVRPSGGSILLWETKGSQQEAVFANVNREG